MERQNDEDNKTGAAGEIIQRRPQTHHDDPDADADPADDVQLGVEHLVDGRGAALTEHMIRERHSKFCVHQYSAVGAFSPTKSGKKCSAGGCYRGDEGLQSFLLGADIFGSIDHHPGGAAAVQLQREHEMFESFIHLLLFICYITWCSHSKVDEAERLLQRLLSRVLVVGVSLLIELGDVLDHLKTEEQKAVTGRLYRHTKQNNVFVSSTRSLLDRPQIPAATSTAKMRSRKRKN